MALASLTRFSDVMPNFCITVLPGALMPKINTHHLISILIPQPGDTSFHGDLLDSSWEHLCLVGLWLTIEALHAWHRNDTYTRPDLLRGLHGVLHLGARGNDDELERRSLLFHDVSSFEDAIAALRDTHTLHIWHNLPRKDEGCGTAEAFNRGYHGTSSLFTIAGAPC